MANQITVGGNTKLQGNVTINGISQKNNIQIKREYYDRHKRKLKAEIPYRGKLIEGVLKTYHINGKLESETAYRRGKQHGIQKEYDEEGGLKSESFYEDGKQNGPKKEYDKEGILKSEIHWKNDKPDGFYLLCCYGILFDRYQYTGKESVYHYINLLSHFRNGKEDGLEESYDNGILSHRIIYKNGARLRITAYKDGMKHGKEIWRTESGEPIRVVFYENGAVIRTKGKDVSRLGPEYDYSSYPNEKYKSTLSFKNGVYLTHYKYYEGSFDTPGRGGELASEIPLKRGLADGMAKEYYQKYKRVQRATEYRSGIKNGIEQNFYPNGVLSSEISFKDGEKNGTEKRYPNYAFPLRALNALVHRNPERSEKELYFRGGIQIGFTEAELSSKEPFEDDDYYDKYENEGSLEDGTYEDEENSD
jgi:antitoxin component YwqK of YwqJK toxin-antitoxin module